MKLSTEIFLSENKRPILNAENLGKLLEYNDITVKTVDKKTCFFFLGDPIDKTLICNQLQNLLPIFKHGTKDNLKNAIYCLASETGEVIEEDKEKIKPLLNSKRLKELLKFNEMEVYYDQHAKTFKWVGKRFNVELIDSLLMDILPEEFKGVSKERYDNSVTIIAHENKVNRVLDIIEQSIWDGVDRLKDLYENLGITDDELSKTLIYKWLWQCLALQYNKAGTYEATRETDFGADGILVLNGAQGLGKTSFFRQISYIDKGLFKEGGKLNRWNKDHEISSLSYWITELGEVEQSISKNDVESIKAFITRNFDEIRLPYGHRARKTPRTTSLCATCNSQKFLRDVTGNRRFWIVPISKKINKAWLKQLDAVQIFAQVFFETDVYDIEKEECLQGFRLTDDEIEQVNIRNRDYEVEVKGETEVADILAEILINNKEPIYKDTTVTRWKELFPSLKRFTANQVGVALKRLGYEGKWKKVNGKVIKLVKLPYF